MVAAAPVVADIADAVWDEALTGHTAAGKTGKALSDAGTVVVDFAPVLEAIADLPDDTDVAAVLAAVAAVKAKTDTLGTVGLTVVSPVAPSGDVEVAAGTDYSATDSRALEFFYPDASHLIDLVGAGAVVEFICEQASWVGSAVSTTAGWDVRFEPTAAQTELLTSSIQNYAAIGTASSGRKVLLGRGELTVILPVS